MPIERMSHKPVPNKEQKHQRAVFEGNNERLSMHEGIAPWCDCCVCEAEPYWTDVAKEMGINLSDYEEDYE